MNGFRVFFFFFFWLLACLLFPLSPSPFLSLELVFLHASTRFLCLRSPSPLILTILCLAFGFEDLYPFVILFLLNLPLSLSLVYLV